MLRLSVLLARGSGLCLGVCLALSTMLVQPGLAAVATVDAAGHAGELSLKQDVEWNRDRQRGRGDWNRGGGRGHGGGQGGGHWDRGGGRAYWGGGYHGGGRGAGGYWHRGHHGGRFGWWWIVGPRWFWGPGPGYQQPRPIVIVPPSPVWQQQPAAPEAYCREYQGNATIDGSSQPFYGTACLQPDGSWRIAN